MIRSPDQELSYEMHVARDVFNGHHGGFVTSLADAVIRSDPVSFEIVREAWRQTVLRFNLGCDEKCKRDGTGWTGPIPEWASQ